RPPAGWRSGTAEALMSTRDPSPRGLEKVPSQDRPRSTWRARSSAMRRSSPAKKPRGGIHRHAQALARDQPEGDPRPAGQPGQVTGTPEKPGGVVVHVQQIAEPVRDDYSDVSLAENQVCREVRVECGLTRARHATTPSFRQRR